MSTKAFEVCLLVFLLFKKLLGEHVELWFSVYCLIHVYVCTIVHVYSNTAWLYRHKLHHKCNKSIRSILKDTDEHQLKEDRHTSQNINKMRDIPQEILKEDNYNDIIETNIPFWKSILFPVSIREIAHDPWPITSSEEYDWPLYPLSCHFVPSK